MICLPGWDRCNKDGDYFEVVLSYHTCADHAGAENDDSAACIPVIYLYFAAEHPVIAAGADRHTGILCGFQNKRHLAPDYGMAD